MTVDIRTSGWRLLHWTYEAPEKGMYLDGALIGTAELDNVSTMGSEAIIGNARSRSART